MLLLTNLNMTIIVCKCMSVQINLSLIRSTYMYMYVYNNYYNYVMEKVYHTFSKKFGPSNYSAPFTQWLK